MTMFHDILHPGGDSMKRQNPSMNLSDQLVARWLPCAFAPLLLVLCVVACADEPTSAIQDENSARDDTSALDDGMLDEDMLDAPQNKDALATACPIPVIVIEEGESIMGTDTVHLHGEHSIAGEDSLSVTRYMWTVEQPDGNESTFEPDAQAATVSHQVDVTGRYTYCLDVCNAVRCSSDADCDGTVCKEVQILVFCGS